MSTSQASTPPPDLFARKGAARPAGQLIPYEKPGGNGSSAGPRNSDAAESTNQASPAAKEAAGSLLSIEFRRPPPPGDTGPGAGPRETDRAGGGATSPGSAAFPEGRRRATAQAAPAAPAAAELQVLAPPATPRPQPEQSHHGLVLAVLTVAGLIAGVWFALDRSGLDLDAGLAAIGSAESDTAAPAPLKELAVPEAADRPPAQAEVPRPGDTPEPETAAAAGNVPEAVAPSFDLIRIEPNGEAILAGRAAPNSELIVLDNGEPIATVTADSAGEWALVPDAPLEFGQHKFALVVSTPQGTVTIPAPDAEAPAAAPAPAAPDTSGGAADEERSDGASDGASEREPQAGPAAVAAVAVPARKPELALGPAVGGMQPFGSVYTVQLASTPTLSGARQELLKLKQTHPELLDDASLYVQKARIAAEDTRYRVRTGAFSDEAPARALCAAFRSVKQDCLVIRR